MKRISAILTSAFLAGWLIVFSLGSATLVSVFDSPANSAQTTAPADGDDHSEDSASLPDCALQNHRIEISISAPLVVRLETTSFNLAAGRTPLSCSLPRNWQFLQRAAAAPRAPARLG